MPSLFVSHGAPSLALDVERGRDLAALGRVLPRPSAILVVSAHWERTPVAVGATVERPLICDFSGFGRELLSFEYGAPVAQALGEDVAGRLDAERAPERGWDHGVWVPLAHLVPGADVPVVQVSLPSRLPAERVVDLGRRLAPLRNDGVLILGSGGLVHNLGRLDWSERSRPPTWALEFEDWARGVLAAGDLDALTAFRSKAPALELAHPTLEHR
jgi:4,5-DOPA dioxygenase extradiol